MLCCLALMDQAPVLNCLCFDFLPFCQNCWASSEVDVGGCQIAEAFVVTVVVVIFDKGGDGGLKLTMQIVVFQQGKEDQDLIRGIKSPTNVLESLMPALVVRACAAPLGPRSLQLPCVCGWLGAPRR